MQDKPIPKPKPHKTTVAWVSRHPPLPAQIRELEAKIGDITIVTIGNTYTNYKNIIEAAEISKARYGVLVIPLSMVSLILANDTSGIVWLRAEMRPAHKYKCDGSMCMEMNTDTDVLMPIVNGSNNVTGHRHVRFKEFVVLESVDVKTTPFTREKEGDGEGEGVSTDVSN